MSALAPVIQRDAEVTRGQLAAYVGQTIPAGQVRVAPGPTQTAAPMVAVGRFDARGSGDVIVEVALSDVDPADDTKPSGVDLSAVAKTLLDQIKL